jgi:hypothetical protein
MDLVMSHSNKAEAYLQFMSSRLSLRDRAGLPSLDPLEERLLEMVALATELGERL